MNKMSSTGTYSGVTLYFCAKTVYKKEKQRLLKRIDNYCAPHLLPPEGVPPISLPKYQPKRKEKTTDKNTIHQTTIEMITPYKEIVMNSQVFLRICLWKTSQIPYSSTTPFKHVSITIYQWREVLIFLSKPPISSRNHNHV